MRAERRAAPKPALVPLGDRLTYSSDEGLAMRAERRARATRGPLRGPAKPALVPSGDRLTYSSDEGLQ